MKAKIAFWLGMQLLFSACTTQIPTPSQAQIVFMAAQTVASNQPISFEKPARPEAVLAGYSPTPTPIPPGTPVAIPPKNDTNIATQIARPKFDTKTNRIYGVSILDTGSLLVTIEFSPITRKAYSAIAGQAPLQCSTLPETPNRLYCHGPVTQFGMIQPFHLYEEGEDEPVFMSDLWIPAIPGSLEITPVTNQPGLLDQSASENTPIP